MYFAYPEYLLLLLLLVPYVLWYFLMRRGHEPTALMATTEPYRQAPRTLRLYFVHAPFLLRVATCALLVVVLARPQTHYALQEREVEGIDIMLAIDISTSMLTPDLNPNRIEAAKQVATEFVSRRPNDNIGLTLFGGEAFTQCPLTTDHGALLSLFQNVTCDYQAQGIISAGTAIGMGLASAVAHLEQSDARSKVVILLTDGVNNTGEISPLMAADLAGKLGVRVYTVAVGAEGRSRQAVHQLPNGEMYEADVENTIDTKTLRQIASATGGLFYQASSKQKLRAIYDDIDKLEKTKMTVMNYDRRYEAYQYFAWAAFGCLLLEVLLRLTWLRRIP